MPEGAEIEIGSTTDASGPVGSANSIPEGPEDIVDRTKGDLSEISGREIQRLEDEILLLELDGAPEETIKPLRENLQKEKDTIDYLNGARDIDKRSQDKLMHSTEGIPNKDLSIKGLVDKWAEAKVYNDKTIDNDITNEIIDRIDAEKAFSQENKGAVLERILKMLDKKVESIRSQLPLDLNTTEQKNIETASISDEPSADDDGMGNIEENPVTPDDKTTEEIDDYLRQINSNGLDIRTYQDVGNDTLITGDNQDYLKSDQVPGQLGFVNIEQGNEPGEAPSVTTMTEPESVSSPIVPDKQEDDDYVPEPAVDAGEPWHQGEGAKEESEPVDEQPERIDDDYVPEPAVDAGEPWHQGEGVKEESEPESTPTPIEQTPEEKENDEYEATIKGGVGFVGQRFDAEAMAHDVAMEMNTIERAKGGKFHKFVYRLWQEGIASNLYHRKYTRQAMEAIKQNGLHANENKTDNEVQEIVDATIEQFLADDDEGTIHAKAGEKREFLSSDHELATGTRDLIRRFCLKEGNPDRINDAEKLQELRTDMLGKYKDAHPEDDMIDKTIEIDNLLAVAEAAKGLIENGKSTEYVEEILSEMRIVKGESRSLQRNEAHLSKAERTIEKLQHTKFGALVGPETIAVSVSIAAGIAKVGSQSVLSAAARFMGLTGASAGVTSGLRKNIEMKIMRAANARDNEVGKVWDPNDKDNKLREELDPSLYDRRTAVDLSESLQNAKEKAEKDSTRENVESLLSIQADVDARILFSDMNKKGLITYSSMTELGRERLMLDRTRAEARVAIDGLLTPEMRAQLHIDTGANVAEVTDDRSREIYALLYKDVEKKDKIFDKLKTKKVLNAVLVGTVSGIVTGFVMQEAIAAINPHTSGLVEQLWHAKNIPDTKTGIQHETLLHGIFGEHTNASEHVKPNTDFVKHMVGKTEINITSDSTIRQDSNGLFSIIDRNGVARVSGLELDPKTGDLTQKSINLLNTAKHTVINNSFDTEKIIQHGKQVVGADEWLKTVDSKDLTHIHHVDWWRNLKNVFDHNELKLDWGGAGNTGVSGDGYVFNAARLTPDGSWNDSGTLNTVDLMKKGVLKFLVYADKGDSHAIQFNVGTDGNILIPFASKGAELFSVENGHAVFNGGVVELVQNLGVDPKTGIEQIVPIASELGRGLPSGFGSIKEIVHNAAYEIISNGSDTIKENFTEVLPGIPFYKSEKLGLAKEQAERIPVNYYGPRQQLSPEEIHERQGETSPRLLNNPDADLIPGEELDFYSDLLRRKKGDEYVSNIEEKINNSPELQQISNETDIIITIPVNAAGKAESENIYNMLTKAYGGQNSSLLKNATILLHVNWFDSYADNPDGARANIEKTKSEINRAKEYLAPLGLKVAVIETEFKRSEVKDGVIGHVARIMNDTALLALDSAVKNGAMSRDHDVLMLRNDADMIGVSKNYLERYINDFRENKAEYVNDTWKSKADIFIGSTSFDQTKADRLPGFVFASNFLQSMSIISNHRINDIHTGGANFGIRASTLAAMGSIGFGSYTSAGSDDLEIGDRVKAVRSGTVSVNHGRVIHLNKGVKKVVAGARIDTDSDRGENSYIQNRPIIGQWGSDFDNFSDNGYRPREHGVDNLSVESFDSNPDEIINHIVADMEATINLSRSEPSVIRTSLAFAFPDSSYYKLSRRGDGSYSFTLTGRGRKYVKNNLTGKLTGKTYGQRKRDYYGEGGKLSRMIKVERG